MIPDYKFDPALRQSRRGRGRGRLLLFSTVTLAAAVAVVYFTAPQQTREPASEPLGLLHAPSAATETRSTDMTDPPQVQVSTMVSQALSLPPLSGAKPQTTVSQPAQKHDLQQNKLQLPEKSLLGLPQAQAIQSQPAPVKSPREPGAPTSASQAEQPNIGAPEQQAGAEMRPSWVSHRVSRGESLAKIFKAKELSPALLHKIVNSSETAKQLARIRPGQELRFLFDDDDGIEQLVLVKSPVESLHIRAADDGFEAERVSKAVEKRVASASGTIESSLFVDGQKAGLSDAQIMELAALFGWDIDFALEIRAGDQFHLLYEEQFLDGDKYGNGPILAAEFVNKGKRYQAYRFEDSKGDTGYYDAQGRNKRRAFIRTPIKFARVSSRFTTKRWHPVLKKWRSHKGVDYAAPTGTPIKATGAGKVVFSGWKSGYGRVVIVQHGSKYKTLYAHMSKFASKAKAGRKVKQGQILGYVGKSGLATGPHLHYEFRVNDVHRNPLTVKLPKSLPLPKSKLAAFKKQTAPLVAQLATIAQRTMVASNDR